MKIKRFDVVELNDNNRATILKKEDNKYYAEIVNKSGKTLENRHIMREDIKKIIYSKKDRY